MPMSSGITAKCRQCGKSLPTTEFVLDPVIGAMVCAGCSKERKSKESIEAMRKKQAQIEQQVAGQQTGAKAPVGRAAGPSAPQPAKNRPVGWDAEDDYLEKLSRAKQNNIQIVTRIDRTRVKYKCQKCQYDFSYNVDTQRPARCPFCNSQIFKFAIRE